MHAHAHIIMQSFPIHVDLHYLLGIVHNSSQKKDRLVKSQKGRGTCHVDVFTTDSEITSVPVTGQFSLQHDVDPRIGLVNTSENKVATLH